MSTSTTPSTEPTASPKKWLTERDRRVLDTTFAIDSRVLAILRISLASFLLIEALILEISRPREPDGFIDFLGQYGDIIVIPFAVMLLLGFKTRYAVILCWLTFGLRVRADLFDPNLSVDVGDYILTLSLFWSMFLPLGRHLSIDSRGSSQPPVRFVSLASAAFLFQIFIVYFSAGLLKEMNEWVFDATAMQSILSNPRFATALGTWMLQYPALLSIMSVVTIVLEVIGAALVIVPGKSLPKRRLVFVPLFIALHVGIAAFMNLGLFPYVLMVVWLVFLPSSFWDKVWSRFGRQRQTAVPLADANGWRAGLVGVAIVIAAVSNVITWMYYPDVSGVAEGWQTMATYLLLYQQWAMFSVPTSL